MVWKHNCTWCDTANYSLIYYTPTKTTFYIAPTYKPTISPTNKPTLKPTNKPTLSPDKIPTLSATITNNISYEWCLELV